MTLRRFLLRVPMASPDVQFDPQRVHTLGVLQGTHLVYSFLCACRSQSVFKKNMSGAAEMRPIGHGSRSAECIVHRRNEPPI